MTRARRKACSRYEPVITVEQPKVAVKATGPSCLIPGRLQRQSDALLVLPSKQGQTSLMIVPAEASDDSHLPAVLAGNLQMPFVPGHWQSREESQTPLDDWAPKWPARLCAYRLKTLRSTQTTLCFGFPFDRRA